MREGLLKGLSKEQIKRLEACKSQKDILELAKQEGIELTDEQLQAVSGGVCADHFVIVACPKCGDMVASDDDACSHFYCARCKIEWYQY